MTDELTEAVARSIWITEDHRASIWDGLDGARWTAHAEERKPKYRRRATELLGLLAAQGLRLVKGEPVAILLSGGDYPDELEFWNHGAGGLTEADKAAGCTEVLLYKAETND